MKGRDRHIKEVYQKMGSDQYAASKPTIQTTSRDVDNHPTTSRLARPSVNPSQHSQQNMIIRAAAYAGLAVSLGIAVPFAVAVGTVTAAVLTGVAVGTAVFTTVVVPDITAKSNK